jgi:hypothetical protein
MLASEAISASVGSVGNIEEPKHESFGAPLAAPSGAEAAAFAAALDACASRRSSLAMRRRRVASAITSPRTFATTPFKSGTAPKPPEKSALDQRC